MADCSPIILRRTNVATGVAERRVNQSPVAAGLFASASHHPGADRHAKTRTCLCRRQAGRSHAGADHGRGTAGACGSGALATKFSCRKHYVVSDRDAPSTPSPPASRSRPRTSRPRTRGAAGGATARVGAPRSHGKKTVTSLSHMCRNFVFCTANIRRPMEIIPRMRTV
jgi:hypothetical protein